MRSDRGWSAAVARVRSIVSSFDCEEPPMPTRVAVNGFGRIGRSLLRAAYERGADLEIVAINDVADPATLTQLLAFDSVLGRFPTKVTRVDDVIAYDGREVRVLGARD